MEDDFSLRVGVRGCWSEWAACHFGASARSRNTAGTIEIPRPEVGHTPLRSIRQSKRVARNSTGRARSHACTPHSRWCPHSCAVDRLVPRWGGSREARVRWIASPLSPPQASRSHKRQGSTSPCSQPALLTAHTRLLGPLGGEDRPPAPTAPLRPFPSPRTRPPRARPVPVRLTYLARACSPSLSPFPLRPLASLHRRCAQSLTVMYENAWNRVQRTLVLYSPFMFVNYSGLPLQFAQVGVGSKWHSTCQRCAEAYSATAGGAAADTTAGCTGGSS